MIIRRRSSLSSPAPLKTSDSSTTLASTRFCGRSERGVAVDVARSRETEWAGVDEVP